MQISKSTSIGILAAFVTSIALGAAKDPNVVIAVTPFPDGDAQTLASSITLSSARYLTHVSYRVVLQNNTTNTLNRSFFSASTAVVGAANDSAIDPADIYVESETTLGSVSNCAATAGPTTIRCDIGPGASLASGQGVVFWVVVKSPTAGAQLVVTSTFGGDEGSGVGNGCCDSVLTTTTKLIDPLTDLSQDFKREVKSFVKTAGGTFFTGLTGVATSDDPWTTQVTVPTVATGLFNTLPFTTAAVDEKLSPSGSCSAVNKQCNQTALVIPGSFAHLQITLQQHPSIIKNGSKIENWRIAYSHDPLITAPVTLLRCDATNPAGPSAGVPCIQACQEYSSKSIPAVPRSMWGIFECKISAVDNGSYVVE